MEFTTKNLPMNNSGLPWGTIIIAVVIIGGVGLMTYNVMKDPVMKKNNSES